MPQPTEVPGGSPNAPTPAVDRPQILGATSEQLAELRNMVDGGREQVQRLVRSLFDAGGPDVLAQASGVLRTVMPNMVRFLDAISNLTMVRMEQLNSMLSRKNITLTNAPTNNQRLAAIIRLAQTAGRALPEDERGNVVTRVLTEVVDGLENGTSVTMDEMLASARQITQAIAANAPQQTPGGAPSGTPTTGAEQQNEATRFTTQIAAVRSALEGVNATETAEAARNTQRQAVTTAMTALNTAITSATPALTSDQRIALLNRLSTDLGSVLDAKGYILSATSTAITLTEYGITSLTPDQRRRMRELRTTLSMSAGAARDTAVTTALSELNSSLPQDRTQRETLVRLLNDVYSTQLAAMQRRMSLNANGQFTLDTTAAAS